MRYSFTMLHFFENHIAEFYAREGRKLPWRKKYPTAYEVWVSEIMLQQTQVSRVLEYYRRFLKRFPDVQTLAAASWEEFLPYYAGLGYYNRGRNMLKTAKAVVEKHGGKFPRNKADLLRLPGVGEYTARAILSFAFHKNVLAPDTNVKKVIGRFFYGSRRAEFSYETFENGIAMPKKDLNAALMDFGNAVCLTNPRCAECPLQKRCVFYKQGGRKEKKKRVKIANGFDARAARAHLFLHKNHREYYSESANGFEPFVLPDGVRTREAIKKYFSNHYGLDLAVRPPHKKFVDSSGVSRMFVNAQILLGEHEFEVYGKEEIGKIEK